MAQHKTISRRTVATDADSVARRLAQQKAGSATQKVASAPSAAPAGQNAARTAYYTPPAFMAERESREAAVNAARADMETQTASMQASRKALEESRALAEERQNRYYMLQGKLQGENAPALYKQLQDEWTESVNAYRTRYAEYQTAYAAYKPYEEAYNAAVTGYNDYLAQQQAAYQDWRSTIRSADEIRSEQEDWHNAEQKLKMLMMAANDYASGMASGTPEQIAANQERIRQLKEYLDSNGEKDRLLQEELEWSEYYRYEDLRSAEDFGQLSQYRSTANGGQAWLDPLGGGVYGSGFDDPLYDYINRNGAAVAEQTRNNRLNDMSYLESMTDDEIAMYNYVYAKEGVDAAKEYLDTIRTTLTARQMGRTEQLIGEASTAYGAWSAIPASLLSVGLSPFSGMQSLAGQLASAAAGKEIDPNVSYNLATNTKNAIRQAVGGQVEEALGEKWGPVGSFGYSVGMSMADMLVDRWAGSGLAGGQNAMASNLIKTMIGSRAMSESVMSAKHRGLSDEKALGLGAVSAAAELITERIGLDELLKLPNKDAAKNVLWRVWKGAVGEGAEEGTTNIINFIADQLISGEQSEFRQSIRNYLEEGYDDSESMWRAIGDAALNLGADVLGGMISGGIFGGFDRSGHSETEASDNATDDTDSATKASEEPSLKDAARRENNPLISGIAPTPESRDKDTRMAKATTNAQVTGILYDVDQERIGQADRIGELIGKKIFFFAEDPGEHGIKHGVYDPSEDSIGINVKSGRVIAATIGHELTHSTELADSYEDLKNLVLNRIRETGGNLEALRQEKVTLYSKNGVDLRAEDADREIVAKYIEDYLLTDEESIRRLVRDDRSVARRILDWLDGLWAKFGHSKSQEREFVRQAREIYRTALSESKQTRNRWAMTQALMDAYAQGDEEAGDAMFDAAYGDGIDEDLLDSDWDGWDDSMIGFSFGGEGATDADREALGRAKEMKAEGTDARTIFRETGWYVGADGKWRFEIDDSSAKYRSAGDAQFHKDHPEYRRYRDLERKFIDCTITDAEITELAELRRVWGNEPQRLRQIVARGGAKLCNVLEHDVLYKQYPQLRDVKVRFGRTDEAGGWWDAEQNEIVLSNRYRHADPTFLELTLLHEIQHAIQSIEGFANGSNPEYWEEVQRSGRAIRENDREFAKAEREAQEALKGIPAEMAKDFWYAANMMETDPEGAQEIRDRLDESEYSNAFWDYDWAIATIRQLMEDDNPKRTAMDLYKNTAGEIEARDTANRKGLTAQERKKRLPNTGNERTVFVEGGDMFNVRAEMNDADAPQSNLTEELRTIMEDAQSFDGRYLMMGKFTERFVALVNRYVELRDVPVVMNYRDAYLAMANKDTGRYQGQGINYHNLGVEGMLAAIRGMAEPVAIMKSKKEGKIELALPGFDSKGNGLLAIVAINTTTQNSGKFIEAHVVTSVYGRRNIERYIERAESEGRGIYKKNEEPTQGIPQVRYEGDFNVSSSENSVSDFGPKVKRYSIGKHDGTYTEDEAAVQARRQGYPVLKGEQVIPLKTWVRAEDPMRGPDGEIMTDSEGEVMRNSNYGFVTGFGDRPGTLSVSFHNKHRTDPNTGKTVRRDDVSIAYEDLTPVPGEYQMTKEEYRSLMEQAPEELGSYEYSAEELAEIEELRSRADMEADTAERRDAWAPMAPEDVSGKAKLHYDKALKNLSSNVARALDVPSKANREFLRPIAEEIGTEYLRCGTVSQEIRDRLFETAWEQGRVVDTEFYDTYKEVKDYLRNTGVAISETDRDSRDFNEFRKRAFGTLKIVNEGGLPVDTMWGELQEMAPALFPEDILNPDDMLKHMFEVGQSIRKVEKKLTDYYGPAAEEVKHWTRNDFEAALQESLYDIRMAKRLAEDQKAEAAPVMAEDDEKLTQEQVTALYPRLKETRRAVEKAMAKNPLTRNDRNQVQRLLRGDIQPEHLDPVKDNVKGILAVYEAKKAFEEAAEPIRKWNRQRKAGNYAEAEALIGSAGQIVDKKRGFFYSRETMERNIRDIVKDSAAAERIIQTYFKPVHDSAAAAIRMKNQYRDRVRALELNRKVEKGNTVSEAYAVQFYGEVSDILRMFEESKFRLKHRDGKTYTEWREELRRLWAENPKLDKAKIIEAAQEFGNIYEELFQQMNESRVRNGYEPVNHRRGYFPHFQQEGRDGILAQFGKALGIEVEVQQLPTTINGLTHTFKPGIRWFGNALERKGFDTAYDAVEGFDRYIEGVADVVHQTDNIQRLRALANQIRYRTSDEGLKDQIRKIQERTDLTDDQKDALIRETASEGKFQLSNFVVELDEYTNLLANKKSRADRNMEQAMGRDMYNVVKRLEGRVAANMVAINPGSWLTNFIPITQGWACLDSKHLLMGMQETLRAIREDDGIVDRSSFLTGRQGSDPLVRTTAQEWSAKLSRPMEWIDNFTAGTLVRARYQQNLAHMSGDEAMAEADSWAADVMADRSKGATPTLFNRSNPLTKLFTQFQLEVNNQCSYLLKDLPRQKRDEGVKALAAALLKFAIGAWLYNQVYEYFLGRRPALDPVDMLTGAVGDMLDPERDFADAMTKLGGKIAENTPFIGGLLGGGRVPISSALPDVETLVKAVGNEEWSAGKRAAEAAKELAKPAVYLLPPFGGGQIKKIWEALKMVAQGGSYSLDKDGNLQLQFPLYSTNSSVQQALELGQAMIFGKTTIRSGREWVEGGFGYLSAEQTATYQALLALDVSQADAFNLMQELRSAEKTEDMSRTQAQRQILRNSGLEGDALGIVYYDLMASSEKETQVMDDLRGAGADMGNVALTIMDIKDAEAMYQGAEASNAKRIAIMSSGLTDDQKQDLYRVMISESWDDEIKAFRKAGMDMDDFLTAQSEHAVIKERYEDEGDMATAFARWVNQQDYSAKQKTVIRESLKYWQMMPADASRYDKAIDAGLTDEQAYELAQDLDALEAQEGKTTVQNIQKWRVAVDNAFATENQLQMLQAAGMTGATYDKVAMAWDMGIAPAAWVRAQEVKADYDSDGNGSLTNADWERLIDGITTFGIVLPGNTTSFHLSPEQKAILWQMLTGSKSAKNNPFSVSGGEKWLAANSK